MIEWLTDTLIATSALIAVVLALRGPVRRAFGPAVAYGLWLIPAVRMVMPSLTRTVKRIVPVPDGDSSMLSVALPGGTASPFVSDPFGGWPSILIALWLAGAAVMVTRGLAVYAAQRRAILGDGVQLARIGGIRLVRSERVSGPMAFGIFDQVIIVPLDFDQRFSECQRRLALDHELAHHRSGDLVANAIAFVLLCLQWFNPLPGLRTPPSASIRKRPAMPGCWTRPMTATACLTGRRSPMPRAAGRSCSPARSTVHPLCHGG